MVRITDCKAYLENFIELDTGLAYETMSITRKMIYGL